MGGLAKAITFTALFGGASAYFLTQTEHGQQAVTSYLANDKQEVSYTALFPGNQNVARNIKLAEDLKEAGYDVGKCGANGVYTTNIENAVSWFQTSQGYKATGVVDELTSEHLGETLDALRDLKDDFGVEARADLTIYMASALPATRNESAQIRKYQVGLMALNYNLSPCYASGEMNEVTVDAVKKFQIDNRVYPVSGHLDHQTQGAIIEVAHGKGFDLSVEGFMSMHAGNVDTDNAMAQEMASQMRLRYINETSDRLKKAGKLDGYILDGIAKASLQTGWDMEYLVQLARIESSNTPWAKAQDNCPKDTICSAEGAFQFTNATWLSYFKKFGEKYGYGKMIKAATGDKQALEYLMDLRKQVDIAASIASDFARDNYNGLTKRFGTRVGKTEVYMAHFFGLGNSEKGAIAFLTGMQETPNAKAADDFEKEANSNRHVFYKNGVVAPDNARSYKEIYDMFKKKIAPEGDNGLIIGTPIKGSAAKTTLALNS